MKRLTLLTSLLIVILMFLGACSSGGNQGKNTAQNASPSDKSETSTKDSSQVSSAFPTKDIEFIVPAAPGGAYDVYARAVVPYWQKYLPNNVNIIVKNKPGGEMLIGSADIYRANPDGYTVGDISLPGITVSQIFGKTNLDIEKYISIGRFVSQTYVLAVGKNSPYKSIDDLKNSKKKINIGVAGLSATSGLTSVIAGKAMGIDVQLVGHDGSQDAALATVRGDVDATQFPYESIQSFIESGDLRPLIVYSDKRIESMPDVPTSTELGYPELSDAVKSHIMVVGPPELPEDITKILRESFDKAMNDPEFLDWSTKSNRSLDPLPGEEGNSLIKRSIETYTKYKDDIAPFVN